MSRATDNLKQDLQKGIDDLEHLRDEIHLKLHLAGMEAKTQWRELERELKAAKEEVAHATTEATRKTLDEAIAKLEKFRASLN